MALTTEELDRIMKEEIRRSLDLYAEEVLRPLCEKGPPVPGKKAAPPERLKQYMRDTLPEEMAMILDPEYLQKAERGEYPEPVPHIWNVLLGGQPVAGPFATPDQAMEAAMQLGIPPNPDGSPPVEPKNHGWSMLLQLPTRTSFVPFTYHQREFLRLLNELGSRVEEVAGGGAIL